MPVTKHEKFIEPPGFAHISQFDLSPEERAALLDPVPSAPAPVEVFLPEPDGKSPDTKTPPSGKKSQED